MEKERIVGNYKLGKRIGKGGMAEVWIGKRGHGNEVTKTVAVKLLAPALSEEVYYQKMFIDEARLSMKLSHSNIVQVFDVGRDGNDSYLVMEWVDGFNLAQMCQVLALHGLALSFEVTGYIIGKILHALMYAHSVTDEGATLGVVHRDVSPQNVIISISGEVKLTDFGIARIARNETSGKHIKGKLRYMAPEQLNGQSNDPRVDLYAVGGMLHELLDEQKFRGEIDDIQMYSQVLSGVIPPLAREGIPKELERLRVALLQGDPKKRVPSAAAALEMLSAWPGFRDASLELGRLCQECTGVKAPRSSYNPTGMFKAATRKSQVMQAVSPEDIAAAGYTQRAALGQLAEMESQAEQGGSQDANKRPAYRSQTVTRTAAPPAKPIVHAQANPQPYGSDRTTRTVPRELLGKGTAPAQGVASDPALMAVERTQMEVVRMGWVAVIVGGIATGLGLGACYLIIADILSRQGMWFGP